MMSTVGPTVILHILGVLAGGAATFLGMRLAGGRSAPTPTPGPAPVPPPSGTLTPLANLGALSASPLLQLIVSETAQLAHDSSHKLVNAMLLKAFPAFGAILAAPLDKILDGLDAKIIDKATPPAAK